MRPKVSIIIPCYNQAAFLPKATASLQAQTLADWECVIVNDGSRDNTAEVANNIALTEPRVRLIQQANGGSAAARDAGIRQAQGDYIQFLDADDTIAPEKLRIQTSLMDSKGLDISYTAFCSETNGRHTPKRSVRLNMPTLLVSWGLGASVPIHSFLYRTDFIRRNRLTPKNMCRVNEDWEWHIACFGLQATQAVIPDYCGAIYHHNTEGKSGTYIRLQEANFEFMAYMLPKLKGWLKPIWLFRISEEIWIWILRMIKYRSTAVGKKILLLPTLWTIVAILLMPLSVWRVMVYFVKTYLAR